jgi:hypothetical protein
VGAIIGLMFLFTVFKAGGWWFGLKVGALLAAMVCVAWLALPVCKNCKGRGTIRWLHQRVDGRPDLRYGVNYECCKKCGAKV